MRPLAPVMASASDRESALPRHKAPITATVRESAPWSRDQRWSAHGSSLVSSLESASVEVTAVCEGTLSRIVRVSYHLRVVTDEAPARVELLPKNIRKFGTITNTLAAACELTGEIEAVAPGGAACVISSAPDSKG